MNDPASTSRTARESLARGLNALQADPSVPAHLIDLAAPIAQAMGALHQLERSGQLAPHAEVAVGHVRRALAGLQATPQNHPAVAAALESVAMSLSLVHSLTRQQSAPAAPAPAPPAALAHPAPAPAAAHAAPAPVAPAPAASAGGTAPIAAPLGPNPRGGATAPQPPLGFANAGAPMIAPDPFAPRAGVPEAAPDPFAPRAGVPAPAAASPAAAAAPAAPSTTPSVPVPSPPPVDGMQAFTAELGAHSTTNFYKGLAGNDVIDHGGLFVSTYVSPKLGTPVRLKVALPGGYEFEANAVVKWTREQGGDAPPGFGATFTGITPEARQLVYRYVRNREPLFYDDL